MNVDFVLKLSNYTSLKYFICIKWILKIFSTILHSQINYHTLLGTPFKITKTAPLRLGLEKCRFTTNYNKLHVRLKSYTVSIITPRIQTLWEEQKSNEFKICNGLKTLEWYIFIHDCLILGTHFTFSSFNPLFGYFCCIK